MGTIEPKLKAMILGVPALILTGIVAFWMVSSENVLFDVELLALTVPIGVGIGWIVLNVYAVSENI